jgi:hypothetical protein
MKIGLMIAAAAAALAFTSPAHADFFSASCTGSGTTTLVCTFNASAFGNLFISNNAVDVNVSGTLTSATETFTGGTATSSTVHLTGNTNVDGIGDFTVRDDLASSGSPGNPTADTVTLTIHGSTNLTLAANQFGNIFGGHICLNGETNGGTCTTTFFSPPVPAPIVGAGLPGLVMACSGLVVLARRRRQKIV